MSLEQIALDIAYAVKNDGFPLEAFAQEAKVSRSSAFQCMAELCSQEKFYREVRNGKTYYLAKVDKDGDFYKIVKDEINNSENTSKKDYSQYSYNAKQVYEYLKDHGESFWCNMNDHFQKNIYPSLNKLIKLGYVKTRKVKVERVNGKRLVRAYSLVDGMPDFPDRKGNFDFLKGINSFIEREEAKKKLYGPQKILSPVKESNPVENQRSSEFEELYQLRSEIDELKAKVEEAKSDQAQLLMKEKKRLEEMLQQLMNI